MNEERKAMKKVVLGSLVILVGPSGAGKSTLATKYFDSREIVSSDAIRHELMGDFTRQDNNDAVFEEFYNRIFWRLKNGQRAVADATHLRASERRRTKELAHQFGIPVYYLVYNRSVAAKTASGGWRTGVTVEKGKSLIQMHEDRFLGNEKDILRGDNDKNVTVIDARTEEFEAVHPFHGIERERVLEVLAGKGFEKIRVVGDVHGNLPGLRKVLDPDPSTFHFFLGDIVDYGVDSLDTLEIVYSMVMEGRAANVRANHERKIAKWLDFHAKYLAWRIGEKDEDEPEYGGTLSHGNEITTNTLQSRNYTDQIVWMHKFNTLLQYSPDVSLIDSGSKKINTLTRYAFAHGAASMGMYSHPRFRFSDRELESLAMFGETKKGETMIGHDGNVYPLRTYNWCDALEARHVSVVGHAVLSMEAPVVKISDKGGKAIFLDTGSSKGGKLSYMDLFIERKKNEFLLSEPVFGDEHS